MAEKGERKKGRMLSGAAALAAGSIVAKLLGALYRVPLTNILGAEGMGMYQLVFPVFALFTALATAGIPTALSRIVAEKNALGLATRKYFAYALAALVALGAALGALVFGLSAQIARWQGNADTRLGFVIIAPTIALVGAIAGFRGWFQGEMYMLPTAISNMIEQAVKLAVGVGLATALIGRGVQAAVMGALLGVAASEACALVYLAITYLVRRRREGDVKRVKLSRAEAREMFGIALPIAVVATLMPLAGFLDSVIIVNMLRAGGMPPAEATAQYGLLSGPVNSLVNVPVVIIMSLAVVVVPAVSASRVRHDIDGVMLKSRLSIKLAYLIGVPSALFFAVFAPRFMPIIYPGLGEAQLRIAANLLRIASFNVVLLSAMQIYSSLLQALGKTGRVIVCLVIAIAVKVALSLLLTRFVGIYGSMAASVAMAATALIGLNATYYKICGLHLEKNVFINVLSGVIMALCGLAVSSLVPSDIAAVAVGAVVCALTYVWLAFLFGLVGREEIEYMPCKALLRKLHRIIRFWEYDGAENKL